LASARGVDLCLRLNGDRPNGSSFEVDVEITFQEHKGKTRMVMDQKGFPSFEMRDLHDVGLPHAFERVERLIQTKEEKR
jgi:hypothetical protein